ncbi:hypothetical protein AB4212_52395, partial [Streptomyces sp. 2MCAF27]
LCRLESGVGALMLSYLSERPAASHLGQERHSWGNATLAQSSVSDTQRFTWAPEVNVQHREHIHREPLH